jgi:hypothetical protein
MAIGHRIINPYGEVIRISQRTFDVLDMKGYLHKEKRTGLKGMDPKHAAVFLEAERQTKWMKEIGNDFQGPNVVVCGCVKCLGRAKAVVEAECEKALEVAEEIKSQHDEPKIPRGRPGIGYI